MEVSGTMGSIQLLDMTVNQTLLCHVRCQGSIQLLDTTVNQTLLRHVRCQGSIQLLDMTVNQTLLCHMRFQGSIQLSDMTVNQTLLYHVRCQGSTQLVDMTVNQTLLRHVRWQDCIVSSDYAMGWTTKKAQKGWHTSLLQNVQTGSGAHPASYSVGTTVLSPRDKVAEAWSWTTTPICVEVGTQWLHLHPHVLNGIYRYNFTSTLPSTVH